MSQEDISALIQVNVVATTRVGGPRAHAYHCMCICTCMCPFCSSLRDAAHAAGLALPVRWHCAMWDCAVLPQQQHFRDRGLRVLSCAQLCSIVVPGMKKRRRGAIVNVGSGSATFLPSYPLYAVYGATKVLRFLNCQLLVMLICSKLTCPATGCALHWLMCSLFRLSSLSLGTS